MRSSLHILLYFTTPRIFYKELFSLQFSLIKQFCNVVQWRFASLFKHVFFVSSAFLSISFLSFTIFSLTISIALAALHQSVPEADQRMLLQQGQVKRSVRVLPLFHTGGDQTEEDQEIFCQQVPTLRSVPIKLWRITLSLVTRPTATLPFSLKK